MFLSVCIPTYNRASFLRQNLEKLAAQAAEDVEIVISDNGSTDDTERTVAAFSKAHPSTAVRYFRNTENLGFDRNVLRLIPEATGEYCWLLGDDDFVYPSALATIRSEVEAHPASDLFLVNYSRRDIGSGKLTSERMVALDEDFVAKDPNEFFFRNCRRPSYFKMLGTNQITMSANVFRRRSWNSAGDLSGFIGTNMVHVFALARILRESSEAVFIGKPLVEYLCNNHRPWGNNVWRDYDSLVYSHLEELGFSREKIAMARGKPVNYSSLKEELKKALRRFLSR